MQHYGVGVKGNSQCRISMPRNKSSRRQKKRFSLNSSSCPPTKVIHSHIKISPGMLVRLFGGEKEVIPQRSELTGSTDFLYGIVTDYRRTGVKVWILSEHSHLARLKLNTRYICESGRLLMRRFGRNIYMEWIYKSFIGNNYRVQNIGRNAMI